MSSDNTTVEGSDKVLSSENVSVESIQKEVLNEEVELDKMDLENSKPIHSVSFLGVN
jgi:hypothetical protein